MSRTQAKFLCSRIATGLILSSLTSILIFLPTQTSDAKGLEPGTILKDCDVCPEMVVIPAGTFKMGSKKGRPRELPVQQINILRPFAIGRYETTFEEWDSCYTAGGCVRKVSDRNWGRGQRPVINVLHSDIMEYVSWITKKTGYVYRLPSEAEWEYSARGGTTTEYWWGDKIILGEANCRNCGSRWSGLKSAPVGSFKANPWGLYDVHGNILEYVRDCWVNNHTGAPRNASPVKTPDCISRVIKGGAWYYLPTVSRSASRVRNDTRIFSYFIGFRVLRELK